jgi:autotransporter translocation and assembly factor TamB
MSKANINIDSNAIKISNFKVLNSNQMLYVDGVVSEDSKDTLFFNIQNIKLNNVNTIIKGDGVKFKGKINGKANISDIYHNPLFYSDIKISDFYLNNKIIGDTKLISDWDENNNTINVKLNTKRGKLNTISAIGIYIPKTKNINFDIDLDKFKLDILDPFLNNITKDITGIASGRAKMTGTFKKPIFNGELVARKTSFIIDYLKTSYNFTNNLTIKNNSIIFDEINVFDKYGNVSIVNGNVDIPSFKNISYNFSINAKNFHALNTNGIDNEMFYGTAFMTGLINIYGEKDNINIDISAKTEKNTKINIPLSTAQEAGESNFITFVDVNKTEESKEKYKVDLSGFELNFDLELTPDAETQLLLKPMVKEI